MVWGQITEEHIWNEETGSDEKMKQNTIIRSFIICNVHQILFG
jgi:hypothetical protein